MQIHNGKKGHQDADKVIWIGLDKIPLHDEIDIIDIPNYYEFENNLQCNDSNVVGFNFFVVKQESHLITWME